MQITPSKPQDPASLQGLHLSVLPWRDSPRAPGGAAPVILKKWKTGNEIYTLQLFSLDQTAWSFELYSV